MKVRIRLTELVGHYLTVAREYMSDFVPTEEKLAILITRMQADVAAKQDAYHKALAQRNLIDDPDTSDDVDKGSLPVARRRLDIRKKQGEEWGREFQQCGDDKRKAELTERLRRCAEEHRQLEEETAGLETQRRTREETLAMRKNAYETARTELAKLRRVGPTMVAQIKALEDAKQEKLQALQAAREGAIGDSTQILAELESALQDAQASDAAAGQIEDDDEAPNLDALYAAEQQGREGDTLVRQWTGQTSCA